MSNPVILNVDTSVLATGNNRYLPATIASGQDIVAGQALGVITASGKYAALDSSESDGTELAVAVAMVDVDATDGDVRTQVIAQGDVDVAKMVFVDSDDIDTVPADSVASYLLQFRQYGIYATEYDQAFTEDNQ